MKSLFITGHTGFVGIKLVADFQNQYDISLYEKGSEFIISQDVIIHLAAKSQDLKKSDSPELYYEVNVNLTKKIFDAFLESNATTFIMFSSVKAAADRVDGILTEDTIPKPVTDYGKSKWEAEKYILSKKLGEEKKIFILRPSLIHGPGNTGNLSLLYKIVSRGIPWPFGSFLNKRSYCGIDNLLFVVRELINRNDISSGIYNIADSESISTNDLILEISKSKGIKPKIWKIPKSLITFLAKIGDTLHLPINSERLQKLTESYEVDSSKIIKAIGKNFPNSAFDGFEKTFSNFK